jgi:hypothetical protein
LISPPVTSFPFHSSSVTVQIVSFISMRISVCVCARCGSFMHLCSCVFAVDTIAVFYFARSLILAKLRFLRSCLLWCRHHDNVELVISFGYLWEDLIPQFSFCLTILHCIIRFGISSDLHDIWLSVHLFRNSYLIFLQTDAFAVAGFVAYVFWNR